MIECKNVTLRYGKRIVASDISLSAPSGSITVLLGKNGSGKTTLLRALAGSLSYEGSILADGQEIRALRPASRARRIGLMPQMLPAPDISVRELVSFGRQPYAGLSGILSPTDREKVEAVLADTGLTALAKARLSRISGGERQKAYFAMLLAQDCPCLLLDEPGAHLDAENMNELCAFLAGVGACGKTVIAVLHDLNRALTVADKILVLDKGRLIFDGTPARFAAGDIAQTVFHLTRCECRAENGVAPRYLFI